MDELPVGLNYTYEKKEQEKKKGEMTKRCMLLLNINILHQYSNCNTTDRDVKGQFDNHKMC